MCAVCGPRVRIWVCVVCLRAEKVRDGVTAAAWRAHQQLSRQPWGESRCDQAASQSIPRRTATNVAMAARALCGDEFPVGLCFPKACAAFQEGGVHLRRCSHAPSKHRPPALCTSHTHTIIFWARAARFMDAAAFVFVRASERAPEAPTAAWTRDPASHLEMRTVFAYCSMGAFIPVHVDALRHFI